MADKLSKAARSENMRRIGSSGTAPEMAVRKIVRSLGLAFRANSAKLPGRPDIVLTACKAAVFVHGCFWHRHGSAVCPDSKLPKSNRKYWTEKLARNVKRDRRNRRALNRLGWRTLTVWECQTKRPAAVRVRIARVAGLRGL